MDDSELVESARSGDQHAVAAIYDRYTDRIHDFAYSILRDRSEAAEVVQETFRVALDRLDHLREPGRLGLWLYAIAHHAALKRAAAPAPADLTETVPVLPSPSQSPSARAGPSAAATAGASAANLPPAQDESTRDELTGFVWQASGALAAADRALLDLNLRQDLAGRDLADAVGVSESWLATTLSRLRAQFERTVGALIVARSNRRDCPQLAQILAGWDGIVTPELRTLITSHVDDCETCNSRRRLVLNPLGVLASVPPVPAPAFLRRVVLSQRGGHAPAGWIFDADGFPYQGGDRQVAGAGAGRGVPGATTVMSSTSATPPAGYRPAFTRVNTPIAATTVTPAADRFLAPPPHPGGPTDRRWVLIGALAGLIVLIGGIVALASRGNSGANKVAVGITTTAAPATTTAPTTSAPTTTRPAAPTTVPPGHFVVGAKRLDFGTNGERQSLVVGNDGAGPLAFTATAANAAVTISPASGSIDPAANTILTVSLARSTAPPGPLSTTIAISSGAGTAIVAVTAEIDPGPTITGETVTPSDQIFCTARAAAGSTQATVSADVNAPVPLDKNGVRLHSQPPPGDTQMALGGPTATGMLGPYPGALTVEWWITATDTAGMTAATAHHFLTVLC